MYKGSEPSGDAKLAVFYSNKLVYHLEANLTFLERKVSNPMIFIESLYAFQLCSYVRSSEAHRLSRDTESEPYHDGKLAASC